MKEVSISVVPSKWDEPFGRSSLEASSLACATRSKFWRKGKRIGKNVKLIINDNSFTGIDIHNQSDLELANLAMKHVLKNKILKPF